MSSRARNNPFSSLYDDVIERKVQETARILGLTDYLDRKPRALSGGQRQRVAVGRAIIRKVGIFLMDEPLSNLDAKQRVTMRSEITDIHRKVGATTIYVTHDQTEAMTMADRIVCRKVRKTKTIISRCLSVITITSTRN